MLTERLTTENRINIILVHGVWCDGSSWRDVLTGLAHSGHKIYAAQLPLTSFDGDVASVERLLDHVVGDVLLVGHSYGGAVISAVGGHEKVKKLVYLAALAPEKDEPLGATMGMHSTGVELDLSPDQHGFVWASSALVAEAMGQDLHRGLVNFAVAVQKPYAHRLFEATIAAPAWKLKPCTYLVTTEDRILSPRTQRVLAQRMGARTREIASSHLVLASHPDEVVEFILDAAAGH